MTPQSNGSNKIYIETVLASVHVSSFSFPLVHHTHFLAAFFHLLICLGYHSIAIYKCSPHFLLHFTVFHCMYIQLILPVPS